MEYEDLYALLGVSTNALHDEIRVAFHRQSLLYHPDKHFDPTLKHASERIFQKLHTAYTVLTDHKLRRIYDQYGMEGVEKSWQLGPVTDLESKKILEAWHSKRCALDGSFLVDGWSSKTLVAGEIDASSTFTDYSGINADWHDYLPLFVGLTTNRTHEKSLGPYTTARLGYTIASQRSLGAAWGTVGLSHRLGPRFHVDTAMIAGSRKGLMLTGQYTISSKTMLAMSGNVDLYGGNVLPLLRTSLVHAIGDGLGVASLSLSERLANPLFPSIAFTYSQPEGRIPYDLSIQFETEKNVSIVEAKFKYPIDKVNTIKLRVSCNSQGELGPISLGIVHRWLYRRRIGWKPNGFASSHHDYKDQYSGEQTNLDGIEFDQLIEEGPKTGVFVELDQDNGIRFRINLSFQDWTFSLPIGISHDITIGSLLLSAAIPAFSSFVFSNLIYMPYLRYRTQRQLEAIQSEVTELQTRKREEHQTVISLLKPLWEKRKGQEEQINGLVIVKAQYYSLSQSRAESSDKTNDRIEIDVTIPLQMLISPGKSQLYLAGSTSKAGILGFYDIAIAQPKYLWIQYKFKGNLHQVEIADMEELILPLRDHLIN